MILSFLHLRHKYWHKHLLPLSILCLFTNPQLYIITLHWRPLAWAGMRWSLCRLHHRVITTQALSQTPFHHWWPSSSNLYPHVQLTSSGPLSRGCDHIRSEQGGHITSPASEPGPGRGTETTEPWARPEERRGQTQNTRGNNIYTRTWLPSYALNNWACSQRLPRPFLVTMWHLCKNDE